VPLNVQKSYVTPFANWPSFSSVISVITTLLAGEGAEGISVGDLLRFGAYAGAFPSPETFQERNGIDVMETRSNNTIRAVLAARLLVEAFGLPALRAYAFLAVLDPPVLRAHISLTLCD
jgi:hypothetical protein